MIRLLMILILVSIPVVIVLGYTLDKNELSADEKVQIIGECAACHGSDNGDDSHSGNPNLVCTRCHHDFHRVHTNAACVECHATAEGLQDADDAHDILQWVGIGIAGATVAGLALNFTVARKKLSGRDSDDETQND